LQQKVRKNHRCEKVLNRKSTSCSNKNPGRVVAREKKKRGDARSRDQERRRRLEARSRTGRIHSHTLGAAWSLKYRWTKSSGTVWKVSRAQSEPRGSGTVDWRMGGGPQSRQKVAPRSTNRRRIQEGGGPHTKKARIVNLFWGTVGARLQV